MYLEHEIESSNSMAKIRKGNFRRILFSLLFIVQKIVSILFGWAEDKKLGMIIVRLLSEDIKRLIKTQYNHDKSLSANKKVNLAEMKIIL
jgi:hypothetical protein